MPKKGNREGGEEQTNPICVHGAEGANHPVYREMQQSLSEHDTFIVRSMEQLKQMNVDMRSCRKDIEKAKKINVVLTDVPVLGSRSKYGSELTRNLLTNLVVQVFCYVAEAEQAVYHQRTMDGIAAAKEKGVRFGRAPLKRPENFESIRARWKAGEFSGREAARKLGVAHSTFRKWVQE